MSQILISYLSFDFMSKNGEIVIYFCECILRDLKQKTDLELLSKV